MGVVKCLVWIPSNFRWHCPVIDWLATVLWGQSSSPKKKGAPQLAPRTAVMQSRRGNYERRPATCLPPYLGTNCHYSFPVRKARASTNIYLATT